MSEYTNIQSKLEFVISLFPQEFISNVLDRDESNISYLAVLIEGISKASNLFYELLYKYWNLEYESIYLLHHAKLIIATDVSITSKEYQHLIETCKKDLKLIDVEIIHSVRKELKIVEFRSKVNELLEKLSKLTNKDDNENNETIAFEDDTVDTLYEYFISCQYYRNLLKIRSKYLEFKNIYDNQVKLISFIMNVSSNEHKDNLEDNILKAIEKYLDMFIIAITDNFILDSTYKTYQSDSFEDYIKIFRKDIIKRNVLDFEAMKLIFTVFNSDSMKPFIWFDNRFNKELSYKGTLKSLEEVVENSIRNVAGIDSTLLL